MTDKQINHEQSSVIIDGIDVSRCTCRYYAYNRHLCSLIGDDLCEEHSDCLYKQLKRKEKSEEKLVKQIQTICDFINNRPETFKGVNGSVDKIITDYAERKEQECDMWKNLTIDNGAVALKYQQQLDQLKAENRELKAVHSTNVALSDELFKYKADNDKYSLFIEKLCDYAGLECDSEEQAMRTLSDLASQMNKARWIIDRYKQTLTEIKEIAEWHTTKADSEDVQEDMKQILQKISECEVESE